MSQVINLERQQCKKWIKGSLRDFHEILTMQVLTEKERGDLLRIIALLTSLNKLLNKEKTNVFKLTPTKANSTEDCAGSRIL